MFSEKRFRSLASSLDSVEKLLTTEAIVGWFAPLLPLHKDMHSAT